MSTFLLTKEGLKRESEKFFSIWDSLGTTGVLNIMYCFLKTWKMAKEMFRRAQSWNLSQLYFGMCKVTALVSSRSSNLRTGPGGESPKYTVSRFSFDFTLCHSSPVVLCQLPRTTQGPFFHVLSPDHPAQQQDLTWGLLQYRKIEVYTLNFLIWEKEAECWRDLETDAFLCETRYAESGNELLQTGGCKDRSQQYLLNRESPMATAARKIAATRVACWQTAVGPIGTSAPDHDWHPDGKHFKVVIAASWGWLWQAHGICVGTCYPWVRNFHCLPRLPLHVGLPGLSHALTPTRDHILGHKRHTQTKTSQNKEYSLASFVEKSPGNAHLSCAVLKNSFQVEVMQVQICTFRMTVVRSAEGD